MSELHPTSSAMTWLSRLEELDPAMIEPLNIRDEKLRNNFIEITAGWALRPPFYAVHEGVAQVICGRYRDVMEVYRDRERFSVEIPPGPGFEAYDKFAGVEQLAQLDGARHDRLRKLANPPFGPASLGKLKERAVAVIDRLIGVIEAHGDIFDAQADFASLLVPEILLKVICGMNDAQAECFLDMSAAIPAASRIPPGGSYPEDYLDALARTRAAIDELIAERRAHPGGDVISAWVQLAEDGDALNAKELHDLIFTITAAALQSTASGICSVLWILGRNPAQFALVKSEPALIPGAVVECLRVHGPGLLSFPRFATLDTEIGGTPVPKGMVVLVSQQAACLDPVQFANPLCVDVRRDVRSAPVFGAGPHICLGSRLAKMIIELSLEQLIAHFPDIDLAEARFQPAYRGQTQETQIACLPMRTGSSHASTVKASP
jgi:cytochrome P450